MNRITGATDNTGHYNLSNVTYDKNGNILTLNRKGHTNVGATSFGDMDILSYNYDNSNIGNKLIKVTDTGNTTFGFKDGANTTTEYTYDANGNMVSDANKGITSISYNHLNLPTQVNFGSNQFIEYFYDASGSKQKKKVTDGSSETITDYAGNYVYENSSLKFFNHAEGYVEPDGSNGYSYIYQYKDHLGNIRLSYSDTDGNGVINAPTEIIEENNYYPFGLQHKGYNSNINGVKNNYQTYQGKELDESLGLNWLDFSARNYDASLGRWMNLDPLAEQMRRHSPYNFAFDNPIYFQDYDGMMPSGPNPIGKLIRKMIKETLKNQRNTLVKSRNSFKSLIKEHKQKLDDFNKDPIGNSSPEALAKMTKDNPTEEVLLQRAKGRAGALEKQIKKQEGELAKVEANITKIDKAISDITESTAKVSTIAATGTIDSGNTDEGGSSDRSTADKTEEFAGEAVGFAAKMTDAVENAGTNIFGDNDFGKFLDGINPLNLGFSELFKLADETLNKEKNKNP